MGEPAAAASRPPPRRRFPTPVRTLPCLDERAGPPRRRRSGHSRRRRGDARGGRAHRRAGDDGRSRAGAGAREALRSPRARLEPSRDDGARALSPNPRGAGAQYHSRAVSHGAQLRRRTSSTHSRAAPTTTSQSRSALPSSARASSASCGGRAPRTGQADPRLEIFRMQQQDDDSNAPPPDDPRIAPSWEGPPPSDSGRDSKPNRTPDSREGTSDEPIEAGTSLERPPGHRRRRGARGRREEPRRREPRRLLRPAREECRPRRRRRDGGEPPRALRAGGVVRAGAGRSRRRWRSRWSPTSIPGLSLLPAPHDAVEPPLALRAGRKVRWLGAPAGPPGGVPDHRRRARATERSRSMSWPAADVALCVTVPEPPAIETTYRYLRASFRRHLRKSIVRDRFRVHLLDRALRETRHAPRAAQSRSERCREDQSDARRDRLERSAIAFATRSS